MSMPPARDDEFPTSIGDYLLLALAFWGLCLVAVIIVAILIAIIGALTT